MKLYLIIAFSLIFGIVSGQQHSDEMLLLTVSKPIAGQEKQKKKYAFAGKRWYIKYNPLSLTVGGALLLYQTVISPQLMQGCLFEPSCSNFSKEAMGKFGAFKGFALSADRLTRCTRLASVDFHPLLIMESGKVQDPAVFYSNNK